MDNHRSCLAALKARIRSRAKHWYNLDLAVKGAGFNLELTLKDRTSNRTATETVELDPDALAEACEDERDFADFADQVIERFVFPVRSLQLFED